MKQFNLEEYLKNPSRKVVTRDGRNVRILCTDAKSDYPIVALVENFSDNEMLFSYSKDGEYRIEDKSGADLFFAPEKHEGWVTIFKGEGYHHTGDSFVYKSRKEAEKQGKDFSDYIASVKIEWEE